MNQPSRLPSLAPLASQGLHTSPPKAGHHKEKPPQASSLALDTSWSLGLLSRHASLACCFPSLAYLAKWDMLGRPSHKKSRANVVLLGAIEQFYEEPSQERREKKEERTGERGVFG
ncbi:hypothetical protein TIFTF001_047304 [Ficus carica]|uniref:Uncharacterized protein n=1 Tax=Ficus carica TaxID=3494 RepID=A0AA87Z4V1_FICCA|nr:hypothetical protein TIFTF001_047304 [Ficus carica]